MSINENSTLLDACDQLIMHACGQDRTYLTERWIVYPFHFQQFVDAVKREHDRREGAAIIADQEKRMAQS